MIDHLFGRPSPSWKRFQVFLVIFFWLWRILYGNPDGPRVLWLRRCNRLLKRFTPWQLIVSTLTGVYAARNLDKILGLGSPEPLANLYSPAYYRATWISTGLDAGFATAMSIRPKWLKDIASVLFSVYYIVYAYEADEKLRRFRAVPTVEMLRTTWEKTTNPYIRALTIYPRVTIRRKLLLPRPRDGAYNRPITVWLFFASPEHHLARATDLILDFPGGGFISMTPEHHEDRLRMWAVRTGKPILAVEYGKAPEYPYPFAIDECFDAYRVLVESAGRLIGMSGTKFNVVISGDSAGAHIAVNVMVKILETQIPLPKPIALVLNYACLDFNFTSWMTPENLRVLQTEQSSGNLPGLAEQKDHFGHISPLSMVGDRKAIRRRRSWREALRTITSPTMERPPLRSRLSVPSIRTTKPLKPVLSEEAGSMADEEDETELREEDRPISARVRFHPTVSEVEMTSPEGKQPETESTAPLGTRLTMTSRTGYFQDRIISPSMMRAMAILYIGPYRNPDFSSDYHISPILTPGHLLAHFPPLLMSCGEKDPFVDDTVIFAGKVREAKRERLRNLEAAIASNGVRVGEFLRMTSKHDVGREENLRMMKRERDELASQRDEDWVRMQIFSDWSHGYLQMPMLMQEARTVIYELADWIDEAFAAHGSRRKSGRNNRDSFSRHHRPQTATSNEDTTPFVTETEGETDDALTIQPKRRVSFSVKANGKALSPTHTDNTTPVGNLSASHRGSPGDVANGTARPQRHSPPSGLITGIGGSMHELGLAVDTLSPVPLVATPQNVSASASPPRNGTPLKEGKPISELELMRRRRLLDSHLLPNASGDVRN
ncbi:alpha/beta-hydrolase [Panus rudis PR-1116 ss-1]|nr:alpha/beta-hydrolase [Panus rudis PR-1116 ss-1]